MRILYVLPYVPSLIRVRPYNFIRELSRRHQVTLLTTDWPHRAADCDQMRHFCRQVHMIPLRRETIIRSCATALARGEPLQAAYCRSAAMIGKLREVLATGRFDVVHVEHLRAAYLGDLIPGGIPTLYDSVDCISLLMQRTLRSSHSLRQRAMAAVELRRTRRCEAQAVRRFDRVAVTSPEDGQALMELAPGSRVAVVHNGVDLDYFQPRTRQEHPATLVFSGKMSYHANVTALMHFVRDIFPLIKQTSPDARLLVVGSDPPAAVRALALRDPDITVTGYLPDIREALRRATVALCPVTVKVGIQNKVLEAMAMGVPVVSTEEGSRGLAVKPGEDLLVARDAVEFAQHVCSLLGNPGLRHRIGEAGRQYVEVHHRWESAAYQLEALYLAAVRSRMRIAAGTGWDDGRAAAAS